MVSRMLLKEAIQEFFEYSIRESDRVHHQDYEIHQWTADGKMASTHTVAVPPTQEWVENPPDEMSKINPLIEGLVTDDDIPLIQSETGARKAFKRIIEEIRIETNRGETDGLRDNPEFWEALHSNEIRIEYIAPIIGLSFDDSVQITDNLVIRHLSEFEKEMMLNTRALGGGSITLEMATKVGNLTHAGVYEQTTKTGDGWEGGIGVISEVSEKARNALEDLKFALRLSHPEGFQMNVRHVLDRTFYPSIVTSHEMHGSIRTNGLVKPAQAANAEDIVEYYQLVAEANEDEGLRVAINRLESSYRKISNADGIVDAVIGIEALLSSGRSGSFQRVRKRAAILAGEKATYSDLGRLQSLRNATVHGEETQVDQDDLEQARGLLSILLDEVITITIERDIKRTEMVDVLDDAITETVEKRFDELLSELESD